MKKRFTYISLIIIILAILGVGVVWYFDLNTDDKKINNTSIVNNISDISSSQNRLDSCILDSEGSIYYLGNSNINIGPIAIKAGTNNCPISADGCTVYCSENHNCISGNPVGFVTFNTDFESNKICTCECNQATQKNNVTNNDKFVFYSGPIISRALAANNRVVLFFYSKSSDLSTTLTSDIIGHLDLIPNDVVIVKVDYNTATDLKQMYGITHEDSFIQLGTGGEKQADLNNVTSANDLLREISNNTENYSQ